MSLEIIIGPMFSGKSSYALSYVRRQRSIGKRVLIVKPDIDNRYLDASQAKDAQGNNLFDTIEQATEATK